MDTTLLELFAEPGNAHDAFMEGKPPVLSKPNRGTAAKDDLSPEAKLALLELPELSSRCDGKERNRLIVKRYYYRRLTTLGELRAEAERLEAQYKTLIRAEYENGLTPSTADELARKTRLDEIRDAFVELAMMSDALREENERLQSTQVEYEKTEKELAQMYITQVRKATRTHTKMEAKKENPAIVVRKINSIECAEITAKAYERITAFRESTESFTSGISAFGWRDCYRHDKGNIDFSLEKTFQYQSLEDAVDKTWEVFTDANALASVYPATLNPKFHELQRLDANNVLYYHTLQKNDHDIVCRSLVLVSRLSAMDGDGCVLIFRSLNPRHYVVSEGEIDTSRDRRGRQKLEPRGEETWFKVFMWAVYRRTGPSGEHCTTEFGGTLFETPTIAASWWLVERLRCTMKVEGIVFGPTNLFAE
ncbi:hypothetical protein Poli38472_014265 [Pythium oligandrum]|uniref:Uncharacterized protein n=1 Tax=Pythium oligandrum TaxID=41045 RepID=A0A8K1CKQ5_PYTOL|nr:hypothetical protein Poli38472_014265 [Pythium oligandrum]|eukprot:TMW64148.1 hypothetical protein Poli38472_014265 [Pythium oligandrum]